MGERILVIHTMKAAGTSLRRALVAELGAPDVYPNDHDLDELPRRWYPTPSELVDDVRGGRSHGARLVIGHVPYVLADALPARPLTVALLREPLARAVSMLEHRRTRGKRFRGASHEELLADRGFVERQVRDYQTKVFAFDDLDEAGGGVNVPLTIDDDRFARALQRLAEVDVLGVLEDMPRFAAHLHDRTGIALGSQPHDNRGSYGPRPLEPAIRRRLEELTVRDALLYRRALELTGSRPVGGATGPAPGGPGGRAAAGRLRARLVAGRRR